MKQKSPAEAYGIDLDYLHRCKESTPEQRLDWLAAAWEFAMTPKRALSHRAKSRCHPPTGK